MEKWAPATIELADTKEKIFALIGEGYRLCIEPEQEDGGGSVFLDEGFRNIGQDRPRISCTREAAQAALATNLMRRMTDDEVRKYVCVSPAGRAFYLMVV